MDNDFSQEPFSEFDWDFDAVPEKELMACFIWEYARESAFIRNLRVRALAFMRAGGERESDPDLNGDIQKAQTIGYPSEVFLAGLFREENERNQSIDPKLPHFQHPEAPAITGSFPNPWQTLTEEERGYRAHIRNCIEAHQLVPFERAHSSFLDWVVDTVKAERRDIEEANANVKREYPDLSEIELLKKGLLKQLEVKPAISWANYEEITLVKIEWKIFTDEQIIQGFRKWIKQNRPSDLPTPDGRGKKLISWRKRLERLAQVRLLHRYTLAEMPSRCSSGYKMYHPSKWYDERQKMLKDFRRYMPFLPLEEKPLSWQTKGSRRG